MHLQPQTRIFFQLTLDIKRRIDLGVVEAVTSKKNYLYSQTWIRRPL